MAMMVLEASGLMPSSSAVVCFTPTTKTSSLLPLCSRLRLRIPPFSIPPSRNSTLFSTQIVCEKPSTVPAAGSSQNIITEAGIVNDKTWQQLVLESDIPVAVDFWAPWCGPCRMIAPLFEELARQYAGRVRCLKLNTDESPNTATDYGIRSIPTVMIFKGGQKKDAIIGAVPKATLASTIEKYLDR